MQLYFTRPRTSESEQSTGTMKKNRLSHTGPGLRGSESHSAISAEPAQRFITSKRGNLKSAHGAWVALQTAVVEKIGIVGSQRVEFYLGKHRRLVYI